MTVIAYAVSRLDADDGTGDHLGVYPPGCRFPRPPHYRLFDIYTDRWLA